MRKLFWILLLANVVLFAAMQRGGLVRGERAPQAQPALHEDSIRLLDAPQSPPAALPAPVPAAAVAPVPDATAISAPAPVATAASSAKAAQKENQKETRTSALVCLEWGDFSGQDLTRAAAALSDLRLGDKLSRLQVEYDTGFWVYIPPLKDMAAINRKLRELKARGIREYFVVKEAGQWRNAISLGVFRTQEAAQHFLNDLRTRKVRTAQVGKRASKFKVTVFRLSEVGLLTEVKLSELQKDFAGSELKHVPCALTR